MAKDPLRILLVSHRYPPDAVSGVERYSEALAAALAVGGDRVSVVARRPGGSARPALLREGVANGTAVYRLAGGDSPRASVLGGHDHERLERLFETILVEAAPDVVHFNHVIDLSPRFLEAARRHRAAVVLTLHDFYFSCPRITLQKPSGELCRGPDGGRECARTCFAASDDGPTALRLALGLRTLYFRRLLDLPQYVLCPSQYVASYFERHGVNTGRLRVVPNGIWIEGARDGAGAWSPEQPTPRERGRLNLAFLGSLLPHKGVHVILEAVNVAQRKGVGIGAVNLELLGPVGDPRYARKLREQASEVPGLSLRFHGSYEPAALPGLLRDVDCVLAPSQWPETFLLVSREALARGVPVVVTRLGALPDCVNEGKNGFTFDHDCPEQLAAILEKLCQDDDLVRRLRRGARATPIFSSRDHAATVRRIYEQAMRDFAAEGTGAGARATGSERWSQSNEEELGFLHSALEQVETTVAATG